MPAKTHGTWSPAEIARLRTFAVQGLPNGTIAAAMGRSAGSIAARMSRLGWHDQSLQPAFKERIVELARAGWTAARIARQVGVDAVLVERALLRAGVTPGEPPSYPNAGLRYGVNAPYPAPRTGDAA